MICDDARLALSAELDSEDAGVPWAAVEEHLESCPDCARWREAAHVLTRRARFQAAAGSPPPPPGLAQEARRIRVAGRRMGGMRSWFGSRGALVVVALAQLAVTVPMLLFGSDHDASVHVAHEMGSFDLAVAVGLLAAAWLPRRAAGMSVLVGAAACLLVLTAIVDLVADRTSLLDEAPHLLVVAGWLVLRRVAASATPGDAPLTAAVVAGRLRRRAARLLPSGPAAPPVAGNADPRPGTGAQPAASRKAVAG